jgi:hypothetical protein
MGFADLAKMPKTHKKDKEKTKVFAFLYNNPTLYYFLLFWC